MKTYLLSDIINETQFARVREIVARESAPHKAITAYLMTQPDIAANCERAGLLTTFFAYQLEALARQSLRSQPTKRLSNDAQWALDHFNCMAEGGVWAVPRSGLMFRKENGCLVLFARMPYTEEMKAAFADGADVPASAEALRQYQDSDYASIAKPFAEAGITIRSVAQ